MYLYGWVVDYFFGSEVNEMISIFDIEFWEFLVEVISEEGCRK